MIACGPAEDLGALEAADWESGQSTHPVTIDANANYTITGVQSGMCLQPAGASTSDLARIQIATCNGSDAQRFRLEPQSGGYHRIRNVRSGKCIDVDRRSVDNGAAIIQYTCGSGTNQQFQALDVSGGTVRFVARHSGKVLDVEAHRTADGTNLLQWAWASGANQQFRLATTGGGGTGGTGAGGASGSGGSGGSSGSGGCGGGTVIVGNGGVVNSTITVRGGQAFDGRGMRFTAGSGLGDGSQDESQDPMFRLDTGARICNVVLGAPAADGIHTYGNVNLQNIVWEDVGEDALTLKGSGTVTLNGGSATKASDKIFQLNAAGQFRLSNFRAWDAGKLIRQNGGTTFRVDVFIDRCDIADMGEAIFRTDSSASTVTMTNTRYHDIGDALFIGVSAGNITQSNNSEY